MPTESPDGPLAAIPATGRVMGLDLGTKTIGVAISDGMRYSATPLETIKRSKFTQDAERIVQLIGENQIAANSIGNQARLAITERNLRARGLAP